MDSSAGSESGYDLFPKYESGSEVLPNYGYGSDQKQPDPVESATLALGRGSEVNLFYCHGKT